MEYEIIRKEYTDKKLPQAWQGVVQAEKKAEILVYGLMTLCMNSFEDVVVELEKGNPVGKVLRSWANDSTTGFGSNAITLDTKEDGTIVVSCVYDMWKLREDTEVCIDLFGSLDEELVGEKVIEANIDIPDEEISNLLGGIQKVKSPNEVA